MQVTFLNPWLLPALALAIIPVVIHLHARSSARRADFPAAVLLLGSAEEITRLRRLREILTVALKAALVVVFVLCAARLVVEGAHPTRPARAVVACAIIVDDSASMLAAGPGGTRLDRAKAAAREVLAHLEAGSEIVVVTFSGTNSGPSPDPKEALGWVESVEADFLARGPEDALAQARTFCESSALRPEVYLLSDFDWVGADRAGELPGAVLYLHVLDERDPDNAVAGVNCPQRRLYPGVPFSLEVETRVEGPSPEVVLELNGRERTAPAEDARFRLVLDQPGPQVGKVTLRNETPDAVAWDDSFPIVLNVCRPPRVACYGRGAEIVSRALLPGAGTPGLAKPFVAAEGTGCDCVFVTSPVPRETWDAIERASVPIVVLGPALDGAAPCPSALLPFEAATSRKMEPQASLVLASPVPRCVEIFLDGRNGDIGSAAFSAASVVRARAVEEAAFFSGGGRPALLLWEGGAAFLGGVSPPWSRLSTHPAFVPFVHELVAHACGLPAPMTNARPGEPVEPPPGLHARSVRLPGGASALLGEAPAAAREPGPCVFFGDRGEWGAAVNCADEIPEPARRGEGLGALFRAGEVHVSRDRDGLLAGMARGRAGVEVAWLPFLLGGLFLLECAVCAPWRRRR